MALKKVKSKNSKKTSSRGGDQKGQKKSRAAKKAMKKKKNLPKKNQQKEKLQKDFFNYVWPSERDVLFRPERMKYVRRLLPDEGCVFCRSASGGVSFETLCVYQTHHSQIVLNKFPYNSGHVLVIPKRHCADVSELSQEEYLDLMGLLRETMEALKELYRPGGLNVGLNQGAVAGAGIPHHLHFHIIPRWSGDLNFFPLIAETKVLVESLEQTFDRLQKHFKKG